MEQDYKKIERRDKPMNYTAVVITAIICITIAYLGTHGKKKD
jgi:hypothetical protein